MGSPRRLEKQTQGKRVCAVGGGVLMAPVTYEVRNSWRGSSGGSLHASQMVLFCRQVNQASECFYPSSRDTNMAFFSL